MSIKTGTTISDAITAAIVPKMSATPSPPNIGSDAKSVLAKIIAAAVRKIGFALVADAKAIECFFSIPFSCINVILKSINKSELRELIPINEINPMSDVAVKKKVPLLNTSITKCPAMTPIMERKLPSKIIPAMEKLL